MSNDNPQPIPEHPEGTQDDMDQPEGAQDIKKPVMPKNTYPDLDWETLDPGLKDYVRDLRQENKERREWAEALQARLAESEAKLEGVDRQRTEQLQQDGNWRELVTKHAAKIAELEPRAQRTEALEAIIRDSNTRRIERLPLPAREAVEALALPPDQLASWLDKYGDTLSAPTPPPADGGRGVAPGAKSVAVTPEDVARAKLLEQHGIKNITPEALAARRKAPKVQWIDED